MVEGLQRPDEGGEVPVEVRKRLRQVPLRRELLVRRELGEGLEKGEGCHGPEALQGRHARPPDFQHLVRGEGEEAEVEGARVRGVCGQERSCVRVYS